MPFSMERMAVSMEAWERSNVDNGVWVQILMTINLVTGSCETGCRLWTKDAKTRKWRKASQFLGWIGSWRVVGKPLTQRGQWLMVERGMYVEARHPSFEYGGFLSKVLWIPFDKDVIKKTFPGWMWWNSQLEDKKETDEWLVVCSEKEQRNP